jgi:hypothetical protein
MKKAILIITFAFLNTQNLFASSPSLQTVATCNGYFYGQAITTFLSRESAGSSFIYRIHSLETSKPEPLTLKNGKVVHLSKYDWEDSYRHGGSSFGIYWYVRNQPPYPVLSYYEIGGYYDNPKWKSWTSHDQTMHDADCVVDLAKVREVKK